MAVLLEGMSLVFENSILEKKHLGGLYGFKSFWDNGSYCTDGCISRLSFFELNDGFSVFHSLPNMGLELNETFCKDVALFLYGGRLQMPCAWLEIGISDDGYATCCHYLQEMGKVAVPKYFNKGLTLAKFHAFNDEELSRTFERSRNETNYANFKDSQGNLIYGPTLIYRH